MITLGIIENLRKIKACRGILLPGALTYFYNPYFAKELLQLNIETIRSLNEITSQLCVSFVLGSWFMKKIFGITILSFLITISAHSNIKQKYSVGEKINNKVTLDDKISVKLSDGEWEIIEEQHGDGAILQDNMFF